MLKRQDTFAESSFKFYRKFKAEDPSYSLSSISIFFFFLWLLKSLLHIWDSRILSAWLQGSFIAFCDQLWSVILLERFKCLLFSPGAAQFLHFLPQDFFVSIFTNTVISRESFINTSCLIQINSCWVVPVCPDIWDIKGENKRNLPSNSSQHSLEKLGAQTICRSPETEGSCYRGSILLRSMPSVQ